MDAGREHQSPGLGTNDFIMAKDFNIMTVAIATSLASRSHRNVKQTHTHSKLYYKKGTLNLGNPQLYNGQ